MMEQYGNAGSAPTPVQASLPAPRVLQPTPEAVKACLIALVLQQGEPLVNPSRIQLTMGRPAVEAAAGRNLVFVYTQDELNPFGRLDLIVEG